MLPASLDRCHAAMSLSYSPRAARLRPSLHVVVEMADDISNMRCGRLSAVSKLLVQERLGDQVAARLPIPDGAFDGHGVE